MASFSPSEVALTGFGVVRRNPQAVLIWAVLIAAFQLGLMYIMVSQIGSALTELQSFKAGSAADSARVMAIFGKVGPAYALMMLLSLPYHGVLTALMNRVVLRPKDSAFGFLRFGADEFRQIGLTLMMFAVAIGGYILLIIATVVLVLVGGLLKSAAGDFAGGLFIFLVIAAEIIFVFYALLRLSLASALTFDKKKVDLFGSWSLTKGHTWSILGAFFLAMIIYLVVLLIGYVAIFGVTAAAAVGGGGDFIHAMFKPDMSSVAAYFTPFHLIMIVLGAPLAAIAQPIVYTVAPAIYQALTKPEY